MYLFGDTVCEHFKFIPNRIYIDMMHNNALRMVFSYIEQRIY